LKSGKKVIKLAGEVSPEFNEEKIHEVRTTIKKMRAIGVWSGTPVNRFFRENYRLLGSIRDLQLALNKIKNGEYIVPPGFANWLETNLHHLKVEWQKKYDPKKIEAQLKSLRKTFSNKNDGSKHALKFEKDKSEKLNSFMHVRPLSDEQIHSGRKTIKEIDFLNKWEKKKSGEQLKRISDETGNFMDRISAIRLLGQYLDQESDESKRNESRSLLEQWQKDKEQEKSKLLQSINSLSP
jgi:CHAD domain-containing protein